MNRISILPVMLILLTQLIPQPSIACGCDSRIHGSSSNQESPNWEFLADGQIIDMKITNCSKLTGCHGWEYLGTTIWFKIIVKFPCVSRIFWAIVLFNDSGKYLCYNSHCYSSYGWKIGDNFSALVWGTYQLVNNNGPLINGITIDKKSDVNYFRENRPSKNNTVLTSWVSWATAPLSINEIAVITGIFLVSLTTSLISRIKKRVPPVSLSRLF